jgi:hypothetical protein
VLCADARHGRMSRWRPLSSPGRPHTSCP